MYCLVLFFSLLSISLYSQDSDIVRAPYKVWIDSGVDNQIGKLIAPSHPQLSIVCVRISGFSKHISYYTIKEIDSGGFYCKNNLGYSNLYRLNGETALIQKLPVDQNYYQYRKQTGTDVLDEIVINSDDKSVTLNSLDGQVLDILAGGKCSFYLNKKIF